MSNSPNGLVKRLEAWAGHSAPSAPTARQLLPLLAWVTALGAAIGLLLLMGQGGLSTPSVLEPSAWPAWTAGRDPLEVAFAILRLVGLAAAWYLLGVTTIGVVARLLRWGRLVDAADILTVPWVRHLLQTALGLGLATAAVTGTTMGQVMTPDSPGGVVAFQDAASWGEIIPIVAGPVSPATSTQLPPGAAAQASAPTPPLVSVPAPPLASLQAPPAASVPASPQASPQASLQPPPAVSAQASAQVSPSVPPAAADARVPAQQERGTYVVQHGDHLWGIAEKALEEAWGHPPADAQIIPYWQQLIDANRAALVDPGNPDLILPGQTFTVPPPPPPSER